MTRKPTVLARLLEWENSCKHPVTGLDPTKVQELCRSVRIEHRSSKSLVRLFQKLSISKHKSQAPMEHHLAQLSGFRDGGFYVANDRSLKDIENRIHQFLWKRYGKGLIYCYGCARSQGEPKRHNEWFLVPISQVPEIFRVVSGLCSG
ncbi:LADA_0F00804g1_1 [Lachancea dasiensis]|uniref:LADA_0F00804g1_1 n=1 Tax=Lachancea dasiensis TaxID=1072105 RepID=A0A1G4JI55_9SACH|nr:LADA_0F00804g1_1 [Lachancea dasiensis]